MLEPVFVREHVCVFVCHGEVTREKLKVHVCALGGEIQAGHRVFLPRAGSERGEIWWIWPQGWRAPMGEREQRAHDPLAPFVITRHARKWSRGSVRKGRWESVSERNQKDGDREKSRGRKREKKGEGDGGGREKGQENERGERKKEVEESRE